MENKKYDLEKAKEDCRRHEDALEEAQSCMCGHCHECGFDPSEMKAALDEVERLRSHHIQIMGKIRAWILNDCAEVCRGFDWRDEEISRQREEIDAKDARIKELEALNELNHKNMRSWLDTTTDKEFLDKLSSEIGFKDAYIKRLEAAFLEATKEIVYAIHEGRDAPEGEDVYAEKVAREALEQLRAEDKIGGGDGE